MFSLIITIISIALVAALALATIYYGGSAFTRGGDAAKASQLINEGQQLQGARTLAAADARANSTMDDLTNGGYLSQVPAGWTMGANDFVTAAQTEAVCDAVNEKSGNSGSATLDADKVYGCTDDSVMHYRF
jgi:O-methyltransferase involved in polyketide biosynthesis